jgi:hypothetical protein
VKRLILAMIAALALSAPAHATSAWYLMSPPQSQYYRYLPDENAPLSQWQRADTFATLDECKEGRQQRIELIHETEEQWRQKLLEQHIDRDDREGALTSAYFYALMNVCVASDDPGLGR